MTVALLHDAARYSESNSEVVDTFFSDEAFATGLSEVAAVDVVNQPRGAGHAPLRVQKQGGEVGEAAKWVEVESGGGGNRGGEDIQQNPTTSHENIPNPCKA